MRTPKRILLSGCAAVLVAAGVVTSGAHATVEAGHPELYANSVRLGSSHVGTIGFGPLSFSSPGLETEVECFDQFFGAAWNEGTPLLGHFQILGWTAQGNGSLGSAGLSRECTSKFGTRSVEAWMTDEPALIQTGTLGKRGEPLSVPWNVEVRCGEEEEERKAIVKIGVPNGAPSNLGCKSEAEELSEIQKEEEERKGCYGSTVPSGCIKLLLTAPSLGLEQPWEGTLRAVYTNGFGSGLNTSSWKFRGAKSGKLHLSGTFATGATLAGTYDTPIGLGGFELVVAR